MSGLDEKFQCTSHEVHITANSRQLHESAYAATFAIDNSNLGRFGSGDGH